MKRYRSTTLRYGSRWLLQRESTTVSLRFDPLSLPPSLSYLPLSLSTSLPLYLSISLPPSLPPAVPSQVLQKVDRATSLATEGETSLFKASQLLEFTFDAYQYSRGAAKDPFDLSRSSEHHLSKFEEDFKKVS